MEKLFAETILERAFIDDLPVSFVLRKLHFRFGEGLQADWNVDVIMQDATLVERHEHLRLGPICFHFQMLSFAASFLQWTNEYQF